MKNRHLAFEEFASYRKNDLYDIGYEKRALRNKETKFLSPCLMNALV